MNDTRNNREARMKAVITVEKSNNKKTGIVSATYAPIFTCPTTCPFLNSGCYAQSGPTALHLNRINKAADTRNKAAYYPYSLNNADPGSSY